MHESNVVLGDLDHSSLVCGLDTRLDHSHLLGSLAHPPYLKKSSNMHSNIENCYFLELGTQGVKFSDAIENDDIEMTFCIIYFSMN